MFINKNKELLPYYELAKSMLDYNSLDGCFKWSKDRVGKGRPFKKGDLAGGYDNRSGYHYISFRIKGVAKHLKAHRLAWYITYGELPDIIDHIDGDKTNNSIRNLRECRVMQNSFNRGKTKHNKTGYKGIFKRKDCNRWCAQIRYNGVKYHLGSFESPEEASEAYNKKAQELHGEFYKAP